MQYGISALGLFEWLNNHPQEETAGRIVDISQLQHTLKKLKSTKITIDKLELEKGQTFSLHYDFGDDWMFAIIVQKIEISKVNFVPVVLKSKGTIEQYPDWDDFEG